jgi:hypothetical protein
MQYFWQWFYISLRALNCLPSSFFHLPLFRSKPSKLGKEVEQERVRAEIACFIFSFKFTDI